LGILTLTKPKVPSLWEILITIDQVVTAVAAVVDLAAARVAEMVAIGLAEDHVTAVVDLAAVVMVVSERDQQCTQLSAITAATTAKFLSNQLATSQYTVAIVSRK